MITCLGELSLSAAVPLLATLKAGLAASTAMSIPTLTAQLTGLGNVLAAITVAPPSLGATIVAALANVAQLQLAIGGPSVTLQLPAITLKLAELQVSLGQLTALAALVIPAGAVTVYVFEGTSDALGGELHAEVGATLAGAPLSCHALVFVATSPADWAACAGVFVT